MLAGFLTGLISGGSLGVLQDFFLALAINIILIILK